ncbi:pyridoxal phosphate-dependent aminotransferase [Actibacterium sp. XHP0104]|uniref:pyridoxal phosphate-dependent aminotransferase n=1 Tax=Actibacterium sp. XHP0104 TaxID=2984335 RepID=UPI0021E766D6|nr:pyridoxal phosphate-dependent aminotransferase [Actibacterium sp. XHP0104]MCV2882612.1 pyridoxal phosphate-dependent aminotransferase [Actibacterium sp. XHP0104]
MTGPRFTDLAASLPATVPFVGPETHERQTGQPFRTRLGANESVFGPSPRAIQAMCQAASEVWKYGDAQSWDLRHALAAHLAVGMENLVIGGGIDGLLSSLVRLTVAPGDAVVTSAGAYPTFNYHVTGFGGVLHTVPFADDREDPEALIALAREVRPKLIYIANPDNPMGTWHDAARMQAMIDAVPEGSLLVLDEAYIEFAPEGTAPAIDPDDPRVIRLRTFSKAYGMAGARVGYAIGQAGLIAAFDRVRDHFGLSRISQIGALAALQDQAWLAHVQAEVARARDSLTEIAARNGLTALPSATNFVTIDCGHDGAFARAVRDALVARGVFVRMPFAPPGDRCIRVSAGTPGDLAVFGEELPKALEEARLSTL